MPTPRPATPIRYPLSVLLLTALAALGCTISLGGPAIPPGSAAPSPEALDAFNQKWLELPEMLSNGQFTQTFTEEEVAAVVESAIANHNNTVDDGIPLHDTRVDLDEDIVIYALANGGLFRASGLVRLHPTVSSEGSLSAQVASAEFGRASLDDLVLEQLAEVVAGSLTVPTQGLPVSVVLTSVAVSDGELTVYGSIIE